MRTVHSTEKYLCTECDFVTKTSLALTLHIGAKHTDKKYTCDTCEKAFGHPLSLRNHINNKHKGNCYTCETCEFQTDSSNSLDSHRSAKHELKNVSHICPFCPFETTTDDMEMHRKEHNQSKPTHKLPKNLFVCDICDHKVKSKQGLYFHKRSTHEKVFFNCELCEFKAPQRSGIKTHTESKHMHIKISLD